MPFQMKKFYLNSYNSSNISEEVSQLEMLCTGGLGLVSFLIVCKKFE